MLCAVYSSPQDETKHSILWFRKQKTKLKKGALEAWQLKKVERSQQRKRVAPRRAQRRAERRRPRRRDRSNQQVTAATFPWRTPTSDGPQGLFKGSDEYLRSSSFLFCFRQHTRAVHSARIQPATRVPHL